MTDISIISPVYNEEANLGPLLDQLVQVMEKTDRSFEIILVDDGSDDGSDARIAEFAERDERVKAVHFTRNFGQTAAMMAGVDAANGEVIVSIDADLQNDPNDIPLLLAKLDEGYDLVSGWRKHRRDAPIRRNLLSRLANWLISAATRVHLHDYGCTLKAYRADLLKQVRLYGEMHRFIPIYVHSLGGRITELPVAHRPRERGESKYGLERILKVVFDLLVVRFLSDYQTKPIYVFGLVGLSSLGISIVSILYALYLKFFENVSLILTPLPLLTTLTFVLGMMFILMGLLADLQMRTYFESQNKAVYSIRETRNLNGNEPD